MYIYKTTILFAKYPQLLVFKNSECLRILLTLCKVKFSIMATVSISVSLNEAQILDAIKRMPAVDRARLSSKIELPRTDTLLNSL
jgi:hypothetical protein